MILKRLGLTVLMIWLTITVIFFLVRVTPGNPAVIQLHLLMARGMPYNQALQRVDVMYDINLSVPLWLQYVDYILGLFRGDLGQSTMYPGTPIIVLIGETLPWTVFTVGLSLIVQFLIGVVLGTIAAYRRGGWLDQLFTPVSSVLSGLPNYLTGTILLYFFAVVFQWFPMQGAYSASVTPGFNFPFIGSVLYHAVLPVGSYVISGFGMYFLLMKSNTVSTLGEEFIAGARAHGVPSRKIMLSYVGPNSVLPLVTHFVLSLGFMFGGSVFVESIFSYPGIGLLFGTATGNVDYSLMQALFGILTVIVIVANLLADLLYLKLDPRISLKDVV